jgi:hypothetical protein
VSLQNWLLRKLPRQQKSRFPKPVTNRRKVRFGWNLDGTRNNEQQKVIDLIVGELWEKYERSATRVAAELNRLGLPTARGRPWIDTSVRKVVQDNWHAVKDHRLRAQGHRALERHAVEWPLVQARQKAEAAEAEKRRRSRVKSAGEAERDRTSSRPTREELLASLRPRGEHED